MAELVATKGCDGDEKVEVKGEAVALWPSEVDSGELPVTEEAVLVKDETELLP